MERMEMVPSARLIPHQRFARSRAAVARCGRVLRRAGRRIAREALVLTLTALGFIGMLAATLVLARSAITFHPIATCAPPPSVDRPIYFMHAPRPHPAHLTAAPAITGEATRTTIHVHVK